MLVAGFAITIATRFGVLALGFGSLCAIWRSGWGYCASAGAAARSTARARESFVRSCM